MVALPLTVELELDKRSATSVANDAQQAMAEASRTISRDFSRSMSGATSSAGRDMDALRGRITGVTNSAISLGGRLADVDRTTVGLGQKAVTSFGGMSTAAMAASVGVAAIGTTALVVGKQLYDLGAQWDDIADGITVRTGKVGDSLTALTDAVGDIGSNTAASLGTIGDVVGQLAQSMPDLAANGDALRQLGSNLSYLDANGQAVNIRELGMAFNVFGVNAADAVGNLDDLNRVSQATGIPINELIAAVRQGAPQFKQFGLDLGDATGLLASFSRAGLDPAAAVTGLRFALKSVGDDARGAAPALADAVTQIKAFADAGQSGSAQTLARETFGAKNFAPFLEAIETGTLDANNLKGALDNVGLSVADLQKQTDDGAQGFTQLTNTVQTKLGPVANNVFGFVNDMLLTMTGNTKLFITAQDQLADAMGRVAAVPITPDSALGRMLLAGGTPGPGQGVTSPNGLGVGGSLGLAKPSWGTNPVPGLPFGKGSTSTKLPDAPVLPYDTNLPGGLAGLPQTAELLSAESSFLDARHGAAEKQARLNQLEKNSAATADEIQKARNDALQAKRSMDEAELRMYDTANKHMKDQASAMEELGAKIDDDFGVSKGLAGIAENITKFLLNLAMVPIMAQLKGVQAASGYDADTAGKGLLAVAGAQGALGPRFAPGGTGTGSGSGSSTYSPSTLGPNGVQPGSYGGSPGSAATGSGPGTAQPGAAGAGWWPGAQGTQGAAVPQAGAATGGSYGLPGGTNTGGYGSGGKGIFPQWVQDLGAAFGVTPSTYPGHQATDRNEAGYAPNPGHENRGIDWSGSPQAMQQFADYLKTVPGMEQVIWNGGGMGTGDTVEIAGGRSQPGYFADDLAGHGNHVHTRQSSPIPLPVSAGGGTGWNGPGIASSTTGGGGRGPIFGSNPQGPGIGNTAGGGGFGGPGGGGQSGAGDFINAIPSMAGGPAGPAGLSGTPAGAFGAPAAGGPGAPGAPGATAGVGPSQSVMGGRQFGQGIPASSGFGVGGGLIGAAAGAASGAANMFAPGAGAAAQIGIDEINRAVGAMGQYAGNAVGGVLETFMLNDSPLADPGKSWFGRLAIAGAGMRPALPNSAGELGGKQNAAMAEGGKKPTPALNPQQAAAAQAGADKGAAAVEAKQGDTNITVNNQRATEDGTGRDIQAHLGAAQNAKTGMGWGG